MSGSLPLLETYGLRGVSVDGAVVGRRGKAHRGRLRALDLHHAVVAKIRDEEIARAVHRHTDGICHLGAIHRRGEDNRWSAASRKFHHAVVDCIRDEEVARAVYSHAKGII